MTATQELSNGTTLQDKYGSYGFCGKLAPPPPTKILGLLVAESGDGKSHLFQTCEGALIFNTDFTSTVARKESMKAQVWPVPDPETGYPSMNVNGKLEPIDFSWAAMQDMKRDLIVAAKEGKPRPRMIVLDTLGRALPLVQDHVAKFASTVYNIHGSDGVRWKDLNGKAAWDCVYTELVNFAQDFRRAGYGFWYGLHLSQCYIQIGEQTKQAVKVNITDNFWSRLFPMFEMVAAIEQKIEIEVSEMEQRLPNGQKSKRKIEHVVKKRVLTVDPGTNPQLKGIIKQRITMPGQLVLPENDGWAVFEQAYLKAAAIA